MNFEHYLAALSAVLLLLLKPLKKLKKSLRRLNVNYQNGNVTLETSLTTSSLSEDPKKDD